MVLRWSDKNDWRNVEPHRGDQQLDAASRAAAGENDGVVFGRLESISDDCSRFVAVESRLQTGYRRGCVGVRVGGKNLEENMVLSDQ